MGEMNVAHFRLEDITPYFVVVTINDSGNDMGLSLKRFRMFLPLSANVIPFTSEAHTFLPNPTERYIVEFELPRHRDDFINRWAEHLQSLGSPMGYFDLSHFNQLSGVTSPVMEKFKCPYINAGPPDLCLHIPTVNYGGLAYRELKHWLQQICRDDVSILSLNKVRRLSFANETDFTTAYLRFT